MSRVALRWEGGALRVLDQTVLPGEERWLEIGGAADGVSAIRRLAVRGAPLIGTVAGYAMALEALRNPDGLDAPAAALRAARPTAVNLARAVDRVAAAARAGGAEAATAEAEAIHAEEDAASDAIARHGADLLAGARCVLTHCNTGALAAGGRGTALAVILELHERAGVHVLVSETRPLLQGARLTAWELDGAGVPFEVLVDGAAAGLMRRQEVDAVVVGCDRVAANGDVANKVGTYAHALAARAAGIPFVVAGPTSSIDAAVPDGEGIVIEERGPEEVAPAGWPARNPAFDITPADLVSALVTDRGVAAPPSGAAIAALVAEPVAG